MEIKRYIRKDRITNGYAPIRFMVHYYNARLPISTGEKVSFPEGWDEHYNEVNKKQPFAKAINTKLDNIERIIEFVFEEIKARPDLNNELFKNYYEGVYKQIIEAGAEITRDPFTSIQLRTAFGLFQESLKTPEPVPVDTGTGSEPVTFFTLMQTWIGEEKERIVEATGRKMSPNTIKGLNGTKARFVAFEEHRAKPITVEGMDKYFYAEFRDYMLNHLQQGINNFGKHVRRLKQFLTWCEDHDEQLPVNPKYTRYSAPSRYVGVDFLKLDQLQAIRNLNFKSAGTREKLFYSYSNKLGEELDQEAFEKYIFQVELARDIFLMCCYTGMRISDAQTLMKSEIRGEIIKTDNQKTGNYSYIPYFNDEIFRPVELVQKYISQDSQIFPACPKINFHLKLIQKLAKIEDMVLTTKIGRKTFATLKIYQGVPRNIVMQATGHKTETSFNRYLGVDEDELLKIFKQKALAS